MIESLTEGDQQFMAIYRIIRQAALPGVNPYIPPSRGGIHTAAANGTKLDEFLPIQVSRGSLHCVGGLDG